MISLLNNTCTPDWRTNIKVVSRFLCGLLSQNRIERVIRLSVSTTPNICGKQLVTPDKFVEEATSYGKHVWVILLWRWSQRMNTADAYDGSPGKQRTTWPGVKFYQ
jgi:hypothetical protein